MPRSLLLLLAVACHPFEAGQEPVGDPLPETLRQSSYVRVATWNIEDAGAPWSDQYAAALDVLGRIDADVVTLLEVEGDQDESWMRQLAADAGYPHVIVAWDIGFGEDRAAVLSRIPFTSSTVHDAFSLSGDSSAKDLTRAIPRVTIDTPTPLTILPVHLKSGSWGDEQLFSRAVDGERMAQAAVRGIPGFDAAQHAVVV
ncbi:MAG: endonuclease/exonuclease/phosphatase family protein, partial [Myxococcales bacterium]|nr:endonuclease/exonuclease/phosphatase family protein [Myxococcales bacterium]